MGAWAGDGVKASGELRLRGWPGLIAQLACKVRTRDLDFALNAKRKLQEGGTERHDVM